MKWIMQNEYFANTYCKINNEVVNCFHQFTALSKWAVHGDFKIMKLKIFLHSLFFQFWNYCIKKRSVTPWVFFRQRWECWMKKQVTSSWHVSLIGKIFADIVLGPNTSLRFCYWTFSFIFSLPSNYEKYFVGFCISKILIRC